LVTEKIPDEWVDAALDKPSAKQAYDWLKDKFTNGKNQKLIVVGYGLRVDKFIGNVEKCEDSRN
jgi:hypothetical protein